jgi:Zinc carboxypeptidase
MADVSSYKLIRVGRKTGWPSLVLAALALGGGLTAQTPVPHPRDVIGFTPGDDYQIADYKQLRSYFEALAASSDRVQMYSAGQSASGNDMLIAVISSAANLAKLDHYRSIARRLARVENVSDEEARALAHDGRVIVWIDSGLHASETAHAQHAILLAYRVATEESDEMRAIRDNVILVLAPTVNPDGLDLVADWYRKTVATPYQDSPMPWIFNRYSHWDNNRDYYMQNELETQNVSRQLYYEWLPQIVYNHHQGFYPARIFVPPFPDPFNPNIDPGVIRGIELVGAAMQNRFEREGKTGVLSRYGFSSWYNGSLRTTTYFHNMIGILSETTHDSPSPFYYDPSDMPATFGNGWSTSQPSTNYSRPWRGDTLHFRDAVDYMLTGSLAVLNVAARYREEFQYGIYQMGSRQIALGKSEPPFAYVIPTEQRDAPVVTKFIEILMRGGVTVHVADAPFDAAGERFQQGSYVVLLSQPFRPFVKDLLEPQHYPDIRRYPGGPPVPPYDNAGWTLSYQMGVNAVPIATAFDARIHRLDSVPVATATFDATGADYGFAMSPRTNNTFLALNRLLDGNWDVARTSTPTTSGTNTLDAGTVIVRQKRGLNEELRKLSRETGVAMVPLRRQPSARLTTVQRPRLALYQSWVVEWVDDFTSSEGWARYVFDHYGFRYDRITNADVRAGHLRERFDVIVVPSQDLDDIVHGYRHGRRNFGMVHQNLPPPEYQGGIEEQGVAALKQFAESGGTLILVDKAADLGTEMMDLPVRNVLRDVPQESFFGPGSIVRLDIESQHPISYGMPAKTFGYFRKSRAYQSESPAVRTIARYASNDVLVSGWLNGEQYLAGHDAAVEVQVGRGRVVLFGFPIFFRAQPYATFKFLFNATTIASQDGTGTGDP